ncbi:flotillin family protein, partial [Streptomyces sp. T-3]|nr:flotillin family protein [Streptomyces sp. T-3]
SRTVTDNVAQGMELLSSTTGVDLAELLKNITGGKGTAPATLPAPTTAPTAANGKIEIAD